MAKQDLNELVSVLTQLLELRAIEKKIGGVGKDTQYDEVRRLRRESEAVWARAHELVYGPPVLDTKPRNAAEAARWDARAKAAAARRGDTEAA